MGLDTTQITVTPDTRNVSGAVTLDLDLYEVFYLTMTGNITSMTSTGGKQGKTYRVYLIQDATGNRTIGGIDAKFKVRMGRTILLSTGAGDTDLLELEWITATNILVFVDYGS